MKRFLKVSLAFSLVCIMLLPVLLLPTTAENTVSVGKEQISDANRRNYVNAMLDYYLSGRGDKAVGDALRRGKVALFFFEGASNHVLRGDAYCDFTRYRFGAVCIVVKLVSGKPQILYFNDECSTIPDNPRAGSIKQESVATLLDGVYPIVNCNHYGYAALHIPAYDWGTSVLCWQGGHYADACYGINIHNRDTDAITPYTKNSLGCILVGKTAGVSSGYNDFMYAATGIKNARSASFSEVAKDAGCVVIDRALYRKELTQIYTTGAGDQAQIVNRIIGYTDRVNGEARKYIPTSNEPVIEPAESSEESKEVSEPTEESKGTSEPTEESKEESKPTEESKEISEPAEESKEVSEPAAESKAASEPEKEPPISLFWAVFIAVAGVLIVAEGVLIVWALRKKK